MSDFSYRAFQPAGGVGLVGAWWAPTTVISKGGVAVRTSVVSWRRFTWAEVTAVYPPGSGESGILVKVESRRELQILDGVGQDKLTGVVLLARQHGSLDRPGR